MSHPSHEAPLRVALVGYGYAGKLFHAAYIDATPGLQLHVVGSNRPDASCRTQCPLKRGIKTNSLRDALFTFRCCGEY